MSPAWWPARAGGYSVAVAGTSLSTVAVLVFAQLNGTTASNLAGPGLRGPGRHLATAVFPASAAVEGAQSQRPGLFASGEASGSERTRLPPQIRSRPTHPVRQNIT